MKRKKVEKERVGERKRERVREVMESSRKRKKKVEKERAGERKREREVLE